MEIKTNKGQFSIPIVAVIAGASMLIGGLSTYFGTQLATTNRFGQVEGKVQVLESKDVAVNNKIDALEKSLNKRFDTIELLLKK